MQRTHRRFRRKQRKDWCFVYALYDADGKPRYVGQTRLLLNERLSWHYKNAKTSGRTPVEKWFASLSYRPEIRMLDDQGTWDITEAVWIDRLTRDGADLLNVASRVR
ncbi:MAG: GIY-YIG nuclease family protein [Rhodocyclaceae bacterium]|nr:GIY-YIG nuclease family protein [Rhodocyclaceae bacterium]